MRALTRAIIFTLVLVTLAPLAATEFQPWFGPDKEFEFRSALSIHTYPGVDAQGGSLQHSLEDRFLDFSMAISPYSEWSVEAELGLMDTRQAAFNINTGKFTARYLWLNDVIGDFVSLTTGATLIVPTGTSQNDFATFYDGNVGGEFHVSVGKEHTHGKYWRYRYWTTAATGVANEGSPWLRGMLVWERNHYDRHFLKIFAEVRYGTGSQNLMPTGPFPGYASLNYATVDTGARYSYHFNFGGTLSVEYYRRLYARYAPEYLNALTIAFLYPLGLFEVIR